jgi:hypothetical protein
MRAEAHELGSHWRAAPPHAPRACQPSPLAPRAHLIMLRLPPHPTPRLASPARHKKSPPHLAGEAPWRTCRRRPGPPPPRRPARRVRCAAPDPTRSSSSAAASASSRRPPHCSASPSTSSPPSSPSATASM